MLQTVKNYVYGSGTFPINTIIGGIGATITSRSALSAKIGVSVNLIRRFEINGNDVYCNISSGYNIGTDAFNGDTNVTFYYDLDEKCLSTGLRGFQGASNLANVYLPNAIVQTSGFRSCNNLKNDNYGGIFEYYKTIFGSVGFLGVKIPTVKIPNVSAINNQTFQGAVINTLIWSGYHIGQDAFRAAKVDNIDVSNVTYIGSLAFYQATLPNTMVFSSLIEITTIQIFRNSTVKNLEFPNLTTISAKQLVFATGLQSIKMRKLKTIANPSLGEQLFDVGLNCLIEVHIDLFTANAGAPHQSLLDAKAWPRYAIVNFYDDNGNYVSTL